MNSLSHLKVISPESIRDLRDRRLWTANDLARILNVSVSTISRWEKEKGANSPTGLYKTMLQLLMAKSWKELDSETFDRGKEIFNFLASIFQEIEKSGGSAVERMERQLRVMPKEHATPFQMRLYEAVQQMEHTISESGGDKKLDKKKEAQILNQRDICFYELLEKVKIDPSIRTAIKSEATDFDDPIVFKTITNLNHAALFTAEMMILQNYNHKKVLPLIKKNELDAEKVSLFLMGMWEYLEAEEIFSFINKLTVKLYEEIDPYVSQVLASSIGNAIDLTQSEQEQVLFPMRAMMRLKSLHSQIKNIETFINQADASDSEFQKRVKILSELKDEARQYEAGMRELEKTETPDWESRFSGIEKRLELIESALVSQNKSRTD